MKKIKLILFLYLVPLCSFAQLNISLQSQLPYPHALSNIWGYADASGNEYALVGDSLGLSIVNVTVPTSPIQLFHVSGPPSTWREVKTKGDFAFVTTEGGSSGLQIVDLTNLPVSVNSQFWAPVIDGQVLQTIHALHVDGNYLYLYGSNISNPSYSGHTLIIDVTDPWNPVYVNKFIAPGSGNSTYVHDGIVMNDTMYEGHIYGGYFTVVDVTDKMNPVLLASQNTPSNFTHNTWLSDDHKTLFTTDEVTNSFLAAYDISDLGNIQELDRIQSSPGSGVIVHNTYVLNDYAVTSWYKDGIVIVDGHRPENLVIVGSYDTYPSGGGNGFKGAWGVYPYLPSGNILVSDINNGLFVLSPTYIRASYLEGVITDSICGNVISGAKVEILTTQASDFSNVFGSYKTGVPGSGVYSIRITKPGYTTKIIPGITMTAAQVTSLNITLYSPSAVAVNGITTKDNNSSQLGAVQILITNATNTYQMVTDANGQYSNCSVQPGTYDIFAGRWGFETKCLEDQVIGSGNNTYDFVLEPVYQDDFTFDFGWMVSGPSANSWERAKPLLTTDAGNPANPGFDNTTDCSDKAYVTDNGGAGPWDNDVDGGATVLTSPVFDASNLVDPVVSYSRWFYNAGLINGSPNDTMTVSLTDGTQTVVLETLLNNTSGNGSWQDKSFTVPSSLTGMNNLQLVVYISDQNPGNIVEGGLDAFEVSGSGFVKVEEVNEAGLMHVYPNPSQGSFTAVLSGHSSGYATVYDVTGREAERIVFNAGEKSFRFGSGLDAGAYLLKVCAEKGEATQVLRIVKLR